MRPQKLMWGMVILFVVILAASWFLPLPGSHSYWHTGEGRSLVQLRSLAHACFVYAANNDDQFPDTTRWKSLLISQDIVTEQDLISLMHVAGTESYFLAPKAEIFNEESVLLYENPDHWPDFVNVAFGDASTKQLPHDEFQRLLAEQTGKQAP